MYGAATKKRIAKARTSATTMEKKNVCSEESLTGEMDFLLDESSVEEREASRETSDDDTLCITGSVMRSILLCICR